MAIQIGSTVKLTKDGKLPLGNLDKQATTWTTGLKWEPGINVDIDVDLWMVLLNASNEAIDLVRYNERDADAVVVSPYTGSMTYMGDDRDGTSSDTQGKPYDENGLIDLKKAAAADGWRVLIIANIYEPAWATFDQVKEAAIAVWPGDNILEPRNAVEISLSELGRGAKTVIFGWLQRNPDSTWDVERKPAMAAGIREALRPFGIE
jgi:stress response protein SCP2